MICVDGQLWVDKWHPKTSADLVGNQAAIKTLRDWLRVWNENKKTIKKALLISGPPGIGKTSSVILICRELGFEPVEVNASDARGKSDSNTLNGMGGKLANVVKELVTNHKMSFNTTERKKICLVMDEVDGMSAGDRGGVADLVNTIKNTRIPIIAICNDKYSPKLKPLAAHVLELPYRRPMVSQINKRMLDICHAEGLTADKDTMDAFIQSACGDIRLLLGQLQMIRLRSTVLTEGTTTTQDLVINPFDVSRRLLTEELRLQEQIDLIFQDADLVPLLVQENYLNHCPKISAGKSLTRLRVVAKAADGISTGDVINRAIQQHQQWHLMPLTATMSTAYPSTYMRGSRETFASGELNFPRFSAWLGRNSSTGKQRRLLGELHARMLSSGKITCDRFALRLSHISLLRDALTRPLLKGKDGIDSTISLMQEYGIIREDIDFITDVTKFKSLNTTDPWKNVETKVKSAFTRAYNKKHIKSRVAEISTDILPNAEDDNFM
jgi:replication factor C subunit 1